MLFGTGKNFLSATIILLFVFSYACSQKKEEKTMSAAEHRERAFAFIQEGNVAQAIQEQIKAVELDGNNAQLLIELCGFYLDANDLKNARITAEKITAMDNKNAWGHSLYAEVLEKSGEEKKGLEERKIASELDKENLLFLTNLGIAQENSGDNASAKITYEQVINKNPKFIYALVRLGLLEDELGNKQKAVELLEKAVTLSSTEIDDEAFKESARKKLSELKKN